MREYLVKLREHRGLTQVEAAKRLLISQSYLSGLETGGRKKSLNLATLKAFAKLYKSPLELLVAKESQYIDAQR
nr:MAG TPA: Helix-turn-helix XRE-family like protein [Caudoviricetes sp.]